ncbi:hypothetical protein AD951_01130 [Acetobacter malorum]|uniref:Uncharacterized protein n=1 Tax=Acetobacter malorum TaxID=178901 RepID=A0A149UYN3_9PROT|nr:hypothetical protein AD951_01130 [Acetobacter malorum]
MNEILTSFLDIFLVFYLSLSQHQIDFFYLPPVPICLVFVPVKTSYISEIQERECPRMSQDKKQPSIHDLFEKARQDVGRNTLRSWFETHFEDIRLESGTDRIDWQTMMRVIEMLNLKDAAGQQPSLMTVKKTWQRIAKARAPLPRQSNKNWNSFHQKVQRSAEKRTRPSKHLAKSNTIENSTISGPLPSQPERQEATFPHSPPSPQESSSLDALRAKLRNAEMPMPLSPDALTKK